MTEQRDKEVKHLNDITTTLSVLSLKKETGLSIRHEKQKVQTKNRSQKKRGKKIKSAKREEKLKDKSRTKSSLPVISNTSSETSEFRSRVNTFGGFPSIKRTKARKQHGSCDELSNMSSTPTEIPTRTPQPEVFKEFTEFESGFATRSPDSLHACPYKPRYCWCTRCQLMYRMYKESDSSLNNWGNYPCFRF